MNIKVLIVDDMKDIREYFQLILSKETGFTIVGSAKTGKEAVQQTRELKPDIILMDIMMETKTAGIDAMEEILRENPMLKIIILTMNDKDDMLFQAFSKGAQDYLTKDSSITQVIQSIKDVFNNTLALRPSIAKKIQGEFKRLTNEKEHLIETLNIFSKLTTSEFDIIQACSQGLKYKQIAKERFVEEVTIRTHVNNILKKFHKKRMKEVIQMMEETDILKIYKR
jgi:DNA-binding NarL/FixJ family response regulator